MGRLPAKVAVCILVMTCRSLPTVAAAAWHMKEMAVGVFSSTVVPVVRKIRISGAAGGERITITCCGNRFALCKHWWISKISWWLQCSMLSEARLTAGSAHISKWVIYKGARLA
jgi:hypothetical protein